MQTKTSNTMPKATAATDISCLGLTRFTPPVYFRVRRHEEGNCPTWSTTWSTRLRARVRGYESPPLPTKFFQPRPHLLGGCSPGLIPPNYGWSSPMITRPSTPVCSSWNQQAGHVTGP